MLFNVFINYLNAGIDSFLRKRGDTAKLRKTKTLEDRSTVQKDTDRPENWAKANRMKVNTDTCMVLWIRKIN